ncbi:MAG TPA: EutN/CcmL family microcompartment protein [Gemmatimonadota bacterium]|nr:EutN/CcmL family microcompartment protein [Gemmatimonadota bacterium]
MIIARVVGTLTASDKNPELRSTKLLVVQPLDLDGEPDGDEVIAVDRVDAGVGERVLISREGNAARQVTGRDLIPLQNLVIGVVDRIDRIDGGSPGGRGPA